MLKEIPNGVYPTMITPFTEEGKVDYEALAVLIEWYIKNGVDGLFAVCQSSEMFQLTREESISIAKFVVEKVRGRVTVIASGHISDTLDEQAKELELMAQTGIDALVLITNRLAAKEEGDDIWYQRLEKLIDSIPKDILLGFYECPYPYKRLLSPEILKKCIQNERFAFLKDTCCERDQIQQKLAIIKGTSFKLYNANSGTLLESLKDGANGFSGVMANFHPDLYAWLCKHYDEESPDVREIADFIELASVIETRAYPVCAKYAMQLQGLPLTLYTRKQPSSDLIETFKCETEALVRLTEIYRKKIGRHLY